MSTDPFGDWAAQLDPATLAALVEVADLEGVPEALADDDPNADLWALNGQPVAVTSPLHLDVDGEDEILDGGATEATLYIDPEFLKPRSKPDLDNELNQLIEGERNHE